MSIDSDLAIAYVNRGNAYLQRGLPGDLERAADEYSQAIELAPDAASAYYNRGLVFSALLDSSEDWTRSTNDLVRASRAGAAEFRV